MFGFSREAVRVKVKKCEGYLPPEWRKFSVDPQITSMEVLFSILAKAFDLKTDFAISYRTLDANGQDVYVAVFSDWDLDAAFLRAHNMSIATSTEPCLYLKVDIKPFSEAPDWDAPNHPSAATSSGGSRDVSQLQQSIGVGQKYVQTMQTRLPGMIINQMEKTLSMVTRALNFADEQQLLPALRAPLSDNEFRGFLDSVGQIVQPLQLRRVIYAGGIEPSLRRVVWKHILNVYPNGMTGRGRMDYMKRKAVEYERLRDTWRTAVHGGCVEGELAYVTSMVRKDVLRTDRLHPFYAGSDDNQNIASLFNILTTYALNHPAVSYCQGMSDIASPLLVTMNDEAHAYICFCAVMRRLSANFMLDGVAMTAKFAHLAEALQHYDPEFYDYLKLQQADDLLFCYRWLLLEMKREFAFEDSLRMLEVLWSALPAEAPNAELALSEKEFVPPTPKATPPKSSPNSFVVMRTPRENAYTKICALRRQSSALSLVSSSLPGTSLIDQVAARSLDATKRFNLSLDEHVERRNRIGRQRNAAQSLDESKLLDILDGDVSFDDVQPGKSDSSAVEEDNVFPQIIASDVPVQENGRLSPVSHHKKSPPTTNHETKHNHNQATLNSVSAMSKQLHNRKAGGHFKELKDRIAAGKKGILGAMDSHVDAASKPNGTTQKVVKNFNEFLSFAAINKNPIATSTKHPEQQLTKSTSSSTAGSNPFAAAIEADAKRNGHPPDNHHHPLPLQLQLVGGSHDERRISVDGSSPDDSQDYFPMTTSMTRELRLELENLDRHVFGSDFQNRHSDGEQLDDAIGIEMDASVAEMGYTKLRPSGSVSIDVLDEDGAEEISRCPSDKDVTAVLRRPRRNVVEANRNSYNRISTSSANTDVFIWENPLHTFSPSSTTQDLVREGDAMQRSPDEQQELDFDGSESVIESNHLGKKSITPIHLVQRNGTKARRRAGTTNASARNSFRAADSTDSDQSTEDDGNWPAKHVTAKVLLKPMPSPSREIPLAYPLNVIPCPIDGVLSSSVEEASEVAPIPAAAAAPMGRVAGSLPPPHEFGGGNPFLMFLCLTLLMQHRNYVLKSGMDYNEMAMHFDKMVRKHNVTRVLNQARRMYCDYLRTQKVLNAVGAPMVAAAVPDGQATPSGHSAKTTATPDVRT